MCVLGNAAKKWITVLGAYVGLIARVRKTTVLVKTRHVIVFHGII